MAADEGSGEGRGMSDNRVTQTADRGDAITAGNQLSHISSTAAEESRKRTRDSSPQAMTQYQRKKVMTRPSFSPHLLQRALGETSASQSMTSFPSSANSSLYTSAPLQGVAAGDLNMNAVTLPSAARAGSPPMTRMFELPSSSAAAFMPPTRNSDMSLASPYFDMIPSAFPNNSSMARARNPPMTRMFERPSAFMPPTRNSDMPLAYPNFNMIPAAFANNPSFPVVSPEGPILTSLTNMRPRTFMPPPFSGVPSASFGTRHTGVGRNMVPAAFANTSFFPVVSPEGSFLTSMANSGPPLMPRPIPTAPSASARTFPHHTGVGRSPFPAAFASNSFTVVSPEGSILTPAATSGNPLMPRRMPTASTASAWTGPQHTGVARSTFPGAFARTTFSAVSPEGPNFTSMSNSGPPTPMPRPISVPPTASARTVPGYTGVARSPVPAMRTVVPRPFTPSANTPALALAPRRISLANLTPSDAEAVRKALLARASLGRASLPQTAPQSPTRMPHIRWQGPDTPQPVGANCMLCKRDLSYTPEGPISIPSMPLPVAILPCGHTFHDHCLQLIIPEDQSKSPPCIPCAIGEN